ASFWASYSLSPGFVPGGAVGPALPPWQSVQPRLTEDSCIVLESGCVWQERQPALFLATSCSDCFLRSPACVTRSAITAPPRVLRPRVRRVAALGMGSLSVRHGQRRERRVQERPLLVDVPEAVPGEEARETRGEDQVLVEQRPVLDADARVPPDLVADLVLEEEDAQRGGVLEADVVEVQRPPKLRRDEGVEPGVD